MVGKQLSALRIEADSSRTTIYNRFEELMREMWQKNGDQCSIIYAGTGALDGKSKVKIIKIFIFLFFS